MEALLCALLLAACVPAAHGRLGQGLKQGPAALQNTSSCPVTAEGVTFGKVTTSQVTECSGLAASKRNRGVYWVNNDSGAGPRLFGIQHDGLHVARLWVNGADAIDWEDIAVGPGPARPEGSNGSYIYIGDTGNNHRNRPEGVQIYRVEEPEVPEGQDRNNDIHVTAERFHVSFPGQAQYDVEAMFVDPVSTLLYIITKDVYAEVHSVNLTAPGPLEFQRVGELAVDWVTGADIAPDGSLIAVRSYGQVLMWPRANGTSVEASLTAEGCAASSMEEQQGEAIAFGAMGDHYLTLSEGFKPPVWYFNLTSEFHASMRKAASVVLEKRSKPNGTWAATP